MPTETPIPQPTQEPTIKPTETPTVPTPTATIQPTATVKPTEENKTDNLSPTITVGPSLTPTPISKKINQKDLFFGGIIGALILIILLQNRNKVKKELREKTEEKQ